VNEEKGVDALEHLAYLIAEEFVREAHKQFATHLLRSSAIRALAQQETPSKADALELPGNRKVFVAGVGKEKY